MAPLIDIIKTHSSPLEPLETQEVLKLKKLECIRCVLFDVYGTLMVSGVGDISHSKSDNRNQSIPELFRKLGIRLKHQVLNPGDAFLEIIESHQEHQRQKGINHPEVEIREVWLEFIQAHTYQEGIDLPTHPLIEELAVKFELMVNATWPMPHLQEILNELNDQDIKLGIVSNAQFFTPLLFNAYFDRSLSSFGFREELCQWSFLYREAKPSMRLYRVNSMTLEAKFGIQPAEVLYVGNDMLNDILPAQKVGFKTALFAGDQRSLRWRKGDTRVEGIEPDLVVTNLKQILDCI